MVLKVNQNYILSAAVQDRTVPSPPLNCKGSYRDMNKLISQIVPLMNKKEIDELVLTHYENESQTLTSDSETNLLKLKEIAGLLTESELTRWEHIKEVFNKNNKFAGIDQHNPNGFG